jgi:hypothetical protein
MILTHIASCDTPDEVVARRYGGEATPMAIVNLYFCQRYDHQFLYDWSTMKKMLLGAGFGTVSSATFGWGCHCLPVILDDEKYGWESPYVEALKSGTGSGAHFRRSYYRFAYLLTPDAVAF